MVEAENRPHRKSKEKKAHSGDRNPKAFAYAAPGRLQRDAARSQDVREKRFHVPLVDRLPEEAPPMVVAIVGPPGVGKTTMVKSLVRRYTKQTISQPTGPLTAVTSKNKRLTFIETPSESLEAMLDIAKVADIVLLLIDGTYGFEMETMEFLHALAAHGMPGHIFGILTHLDLFRGKPESLQAQKKRLRHRLWRELYPGAKMFIMSGVLNGRYPDKEVLNMSRYLAIMKKPRPLIWRNSHPYCLADRFLDLTPPEKVESDPKCDREVALYGYLRGTNLPDQGARVHVPGVGDLSVLRVEPLPDPCPTPAREDAIAAEDGTRKTRRRLGEKRKLLFAPMSDVGGVLVDRDAVYVDIKTSSFTQAEDEEDGDRGLGEQMVLNMQGDRQLLGTSAAGVKLFAGGGALDLQQGSQAGADTGRKTRRRPRQTYTDTEADMFDGSADADEISEDDLPSPASKRSRLGQNGDANDGEQEAVDYADSDSDIGSLASQDDFELLGAESDEDDGEVEDDERDNGGLRWKDNLASQAARLHGTKMPYRTAELARLMYDDSLTPSQVIQRWSGAETGSTHHDGFDEADALFQIAGHETDDELDEEAEPQMDFQPLEEKWSKSENLESLSRRFAAARITNGHTSGLANGESNFQAGHSADEDDEGDGALADIEAGEVFGDEEADSAVDKGAAIAAEREQNAKRKEELRSRFEEEDRDGFVRMKADGRSADRTDEQDFGEDDWYDEQKAAMQQQTDINRKEFDRMDKLSRARVEGHRAGTYVKITLADVPFEFCVNFNSRFPILIGGLTPLEDRLGFIQCRIKRHRWHKKILKTNDPLIFSVGWRRFQSLPLFSISDSRTRNRMLKYTPEHMHCFGTFYAPLVAPNTGFCCVQSLSSRTPGFRISATGVVLSVDQGGNEIVKKLKLTGQPFKIFKNTAFIRDMFSSSLEITKFEGAAVRTVSGVRGQIKKALSKPEGCFRATFEDKILMSDIVFLRSWYQIRPHRFYNPVTNLLSNHGNSTTAIDATEGTSDTIDASEDGWRGMRLTGEVRATEGQAVPDEPNSRYRPVERQTRHFNPLRIPKKLASGLPFKSQPIYTAPRPQKTYMQQRAVLPGGPTEKSARALLHHVAALRNERTAKRAVKKQEQRQTYLKKVADSDERRRDREKRERDEYWRREGKRKGRQDGDGGGKRRKT